MDSISREIKRQETATLGALIETVDRPVHTPRRERQAVRLLLEGIADWLTDEPTIEALLVEDLARMIARCEDREELRDLSVQIRELMLDFEPDASRVALTEEESMVWDKIGLLAR